MVASSIWTDFEKYIVFPKRTIFSFGKTPKEAPEKEFTSEKLLDEDDYFNDDFDNIDDIDFDNY